MASTAILWFRRDLRVTDHPALVAAVEGHDRVLPLFVHDPHLVGPSGANRLAFLHATLDALDADLGGALVERTGDPVAVVPASAADVGATTVYVTRDFGPYGARRDDAVAEALTVDGRRFERVGTPYAVAPGTIRTKSGTPYKVFTPFSRAWRAHGHDDPLPVPEGVTWRDGPASDPRPDVDTDAVVALPEAGERAAGRAFDRFVADHLEGYDDDRDRPDLEATSRLSPHLKLGAIHPRQLLAELEGAGRSGAGVERFVTELCWRDFYADVLHHHPDSARHDLTDALAGMPWDAGAEADERFEAWCAGRTGYPIVDAGMRQLLAEGWMHNRVRMIVASFLVKDLHVDWRRGAAWFMRHLIDGDLASNQHGWQWTAGSGTDASPFFRVFNPTTQGKRFDPDGDYVRRHVPELRHVAGAEVHEPAEADAPGLFDEAGGDRYPAPIVDHATERREALARYERARA